MSALHVGNAGLVLLTPFLRHLFDRVGAMSVDPDGRPAICGGEAMSRAVHLLQYIADGRLNAPDRELMLNKLLCGLPIDQPVSASLDAMPGDLETCETLIAAVIAKWPIVGSTSRDALRETFLQRDGRLSAVGNDWQLTVQRRAFDILLDQVPWSYTVIINPWMPAPIRVNW